MGNTKIVSTALFFLIAMLGSAYADNNAVYTKALMATFGSGCRSHGDLTTTSLEHTDAIINMIEAIQDDKQCAQWAQGVKSAIGGIDSYKLSINNYKADFLSSEISSLQNAIEIEDNPNVNSALATIIVEKKVELAIMGANIDETLWQNRKGSISNFNQFSSNLSTTLNSNAKCLKKYPGIIMQIGGQVMNIAGNFNMWGNIAGIGLMGVGAATDLAISAIRSNIFYKQVNKLEESKLTEALICAFEKVSATYCDSRKLDRRVIEFGQEDYANEESKWPSIRIAKSLPIYKTWVAELVSASPSVNTIMSEKKKTVIKMRENLYIVKEFMTAHLSEGISAIGFAENKDQVNAIMRETLLKMGREVTRLSKESSTNPFKGVFKKFDKDPVVYFYTGVLEPRYTLLESADSYIKRVQGSLDAPSAELVAERLYKILKKSLVYVELQFRIISETDPKLVLVNGEVGHKTIVNIMSPIEMLKTVKTYLKNVIYFHEDTIPPHMLYVIQETRDIVNKAITEYEEPIDKEKLYDSHMKVAKLQHILAPLTKISFLEDRLKKIINFDIRQRLKTGFFPSKIKSLLQLSLNDSFTTLQHYVGLDLNMMQMDARGAMRNSFENLSALTKIFDAKIKKILKNLTKKIKKYPSVRSFVDTKNMLCSSILSAPNLSWPYKDKIFNYCRGARLKSVYKYSSLELSYDYFNNKDFEERVCAYDTYLFKNSNYQKLRFEN